MLTILDGSFAAIYANVIPPANLQNATGSSNSSLNRVAILPDQTTTDTLSISAGVLVFIYLD